MVLNVHTEGITDGGLQLGTGRTGGEWGYQSTVSGGGGGKRVVILSLFLTVTVTTTRMTPALRWAAMKAILMSLIVSDSHKSHNAAHSSFSPPLFRLFSVTCGESAGLA